MEEAFSNRCTSLGRIKRVGDEFLSPSKMKKSESSDDQDFINYAFDPPSLQNISVMAVALKLWGHPEKKAWGEEYGFDDTYDDFDFEGDDNLSKMGEMAVKKLERIRLPDLLKRQIYRTFRPIALQWIGWFKYAKGEKYSRYCNLNELYNEQGSSYWTMDGIVDVAKIMRDIIIRSKKLDDAVDFTFLYGSACMYCIEEHIPDLWFKVLKKKQNYKPYTGDYNMHVIAYWSALLRNELGNLVEELSYYDEEFVYDVDLSIHQNMVASCIASGNVIAFKYFWNKLPEVEKNTDEWIELVIRFLKKYNFDCYEDGFEFSDNYFWGNSDFKSIAVLIDLSEDNFEYQDYNSHTYILGFLLSHLNSSAEQREIFLKYPKVILLALFSHWPLQRFFLPTITVMFSFLNDNIYVGIMEKIANGIIEKRTEVLLREVWHVTPLNLKKAFLNFLTSHEKIIAQLLCIDDLITVDIILSDATVGERKEILFGMIEEDEFYTFLATNRSATTTIDNLVLKAFSSDCVLNSLKEEIMVKYAEDLSKLWIASGNFLSIHKLWSWAFQSLKKANEFKMRTINVEYMYTTLIVLNDYDNVDAFLNWYFKDEKEVLEFKESFVLKDNFEACKSLMDDFSKKGKNGWKLFERFQSYTYENEDKISQFKEVFSELDRKDEFFTERDFEQLINISSNDLDLDN